MCLKNPQADRRQAHAELVRAKADAEATAAASKARETARTERLEEQLRGKARAESEAEVCSCGCRFLCFVDVALVVLILHRTAGEARSEGGACC